MIAKTFRLSLMLTACGALAACVTPQYPTRGPSASAPPTTGQGAYKLGEPYQVGGVWYVPREQPDYDEVGVASWYGDAFHMKATANGEIFDMNRISAAHTTLPLPSMVEVTNLENGKRLTVRVNDRGPFVGGRIIDLSRQAAQELGYDRQGVAKVRVRYVGPAPLLGRKAGVRVAEAPSPAAPRSLRGDEAMEIAAGTSAPAELQTTAPPEGVESRPLPPISAPVAVAALPSVSPAPTPEISPPPTTAPASPLRVQAGAYSSQANAERAAQQLAVAGRAVIEPVERGGVTLYRVLLPAPADEVEAYALRDRVAAFGFADARVVGAF